MPEDDPSVETRPVRVDDPNLSPEANQALTDELQQAVGADRVEVPAGAPHPERDVRGAQGGVSAALGRNRLLISITLVAALVVGAILVLATDKWWALLPPLAVHAIGTFAIAFVVVRMIAQPEAPDPAVTARLQDEGVAEPERAFNEMVREFGGGGEDAGAEEVVTTGDNQRTQDASEAPASAAAEQSTAMTPSHGPSEPAGEDDSVVLVFQYTIIAGLVVLSIVTAFVLGENGWILPLVMLPLCVLWIGYQQLAKRRPGS